MEFCDHAVIGAGAIVDVGELSDGEAIERFWPTGEDDFFASQRELVWFNACSPDPAGDADPKDAESGSASDASEVDFFSLAGH